MLYHVRNYFSIKYTHIGVLFCFVVVTLRWTNLVNTTIHLFYISQSTIQNRNVHISVLNGALWDMGLVHCGVCEWGHFLVGSCPVVLLQGCITGTVKWTRRIEVTSTDTKLRQNSLTHWGRDKMAAISHVFNCIFLNENIWILIGVSLKFVLKGPMNKKPPLVQIMACRWRGTKPLFESNESLVYCITWPQWVKAWPNACKTGISTRYWEKGNVIVFIHSGRYDVL